jgi:sterol desaturase/sphingolipid hydroxylase (fatty acid hydroxylase superfamily)
MEILITLKNELLGFLGINEVWKLLQTGDFSIFLTWEGIKAVLIPFIPLLLLLELVLGFINKKPDTKVYPATFLIYVLNRLISRVIAIGMTAIIIAHLQSYALFQTTLTWYWLIYGYVVWEFAHFVYHYLGHKVRLFWCLHSTHHTPEDMNLSVTYAHFFLEGAYADTIRSTICILAGVHPALLFLVMFIDGTYGGFIHIGESISKSGRIGIYSKWLLTPLHHRIHHARNPLYMDTNYCNMLNIWDRVFGTFQEEDKNVKIEYGITRKVNMKNIFDVYFGEFYELFKDMGHAPGFKNKVLYMFMPPGWNHNGQHQTAKIVRDSYLKNEEVSVIK